jgi:hypothetical protein
VPTSRHHAAAAILVVTALSAAACGSGSGTSAPSGPPLAVVQAASDRTISTGTAKAALSLTADLAHLPQGASASTASNGSFAVDATGAFDLASKASRIDLDLSHLPANMRSQVRGTRLVMLIEQGAVYVEAAGLKVSSAKPWIKLDSSNFGSGTFDLSQLAVFSPTQATDLLKQLGTVTAAGHDTVRGAATTHYRASIDMGRALSILGNSSTGSLTAGSGIGAGLFGSLLGNTMVPIDMWIDGSGRLRKFTSQIDVLPLLKALVNAFSFGTSTSTIPAGAKALIGLSFELYDFGAKVDVAPPPADQVGPPPPGFTLFNSPASH